jgi:hypothetical protein
LTEPVITINGRTLLGPQAMAVRVAITSYHQELQDPDHLGTDRDARRLTHAYRDRLDEVLRFILSPERSHQVTVAMHQQRRDRILQLAGIVPEQATPSQRDKAVGLAASDMAIDEAASRLQQED